MGNCRNSIFTKALAAFLIVAVCAVFAPSNISSNRASAASTSQYVVKSGDMLYLIAKNYNTSVAAVMAINNLNSYIIMPGQVLVIPAGTQSVPNQYVIKSGDTLYLISQKYGITVSELLWANNLKSSLIMVGQVLTIPSRQAGALKDIIAQKGIFPQNVNLGIVVDKSEHVLGVFSGQTFLKSYHVELGSGGLGDKQVLGDRKTPEGRFYVAQMSIIDPADQYLGTRWMRLSYPNIEDADRGLSQGIIDQKTHDSIVNAMNNGQIPPQDTPLGGGVGIHGGSTHELGSDWTYGCVGLTNADVQDFYNYVAVGTSVLIQR